MNIFLLAFLIVIVSWILTGAIRHYALHSSLMDIPNERSSHIIPTPRGGGLAIVISFFGAITLLYWKQYIPLNLFLAILSGGSIVSCVGYLDDRYTIAVRWRLFAQFLGAAFALYCLHPEQLLIIYHWSLTTNPFTNLLLLFGIVWFTNIYNFMDGIDGLAASQAVFFGLTATLFMFPSSIALINSILAAAVIGFLIWNWPPAKIFMGDVGSSFLGFVFAILMIYAAQQQQWSLAGQLILFAIFITDTTFTLLSRLRQGKKIYQAHREHAYQRLVQQGRSHLTVTQMTILLNFTVLLPLAWVAFIYPENIFYIVVIIGSGYYLLWWKITQSFRKKNVI